MGRVLRLVFLGPVILELRIFRVPAWGLDSRGCEVRFGPGNATLVLSMKAHISARRWPNNLASLGHKSPKPRSQSSYGS